jgi:hypothetical protein
VPAQASTEGKLGEYLSADWRGRGRAARDDKQPSSSRREGYIARMQVGSPGLKGPMPGLRPSVEVVGPRTPVVPSVA